MYSKVPYLTCMLVMGAMLATLFPRASLSETLIIGRVSTNVSKSVQKLLPISQYVVKNLPGSRFKDASVYVAKDIDELIQSANQGDVHWVTESAYSAALLMKKAGMTPLLVRHKKGHAEYGSVIVANKQIHSLNDLLGRTLAAEDSGSFSAYFLAYRALIEEGLAVHELSGIRQSPLLGKANIIYSDDEDNSKEWLQLGLVDSAVFSNLDYDDPIFFTADLKEKTQVIYQSERYPRMVEMFSKEILPEERAEIKRILLGLDMNVEAQAELLQKYDRTSGFSEFDSAKRLQLNDINRFLESLEE